MKQTPRQRVMAALRGDKPEAIPFTAYEEMLPRCVVERDLRNRGLCLVRRVQSYRTTRPNVTWREERYLDEKGRHLVHTVFSTPDGDLSTVDEPAGFTSWRHEHLFKSPDDYSALLFLIQDTVVEPNYGPVSRLSEELGEDFVVRDNLPLEPIQDLISSHLMSMEDFGVQWMENRDEVLKLYHALVEVARKIYPIVADGPLEFCNYGGNVVPSVIGPNVFRDYYIPHYEEAAEALHKKGKLLGTHLDADNTPIMDLVARTSLDYIEAYDPGMGPSVAEARAAWPDKVLWINWPSAWHLRPVEEVRTGTIQLLREASPGDRFIIGITEDVPEERWAENFTAIVDAIEGEAMRGAEPD